MARCGSRKTAHLLGGQKIVVRGDRGLVLRFAAGRVLAGRFQDAHPSGAMIPGIVVGTAAHRFAPTIADPVGRVLIGIPAVNDRSKGAHRSGVIA